MSVLSSKNNILEEKQSRKEIEDSWQDLAESLTKFIFQAVNVPIEEEITLE